MNTDVKHRCDDHQCSAPGVQNIPAPSRPKQGYRHLSSLGQEEQHDTRYSCEDEQQAKRETERQIQSPIAIHAATSSPDLADHAPSHADEPGPMRHQMECGNCDHQHASPGVNVIPGGTAEDQFHPIPWIATPSEPSGKEEKIDP